MKNGIYPALKLIKKSIFSIEIALFIQIGYNSLKRSPHFGFFTKVRMLSLPNLENCHMVVAFTRFLKRYRLLAEKAISFVKAFCLVIAS
jgi:hypothetical protein